MTSILDQQDENDREYLSLIGIKESKALSPDGEAKGGIDGRPLSPAFLATPTARLDPTCLTCANQPGEKKLLFEQFKMACMQYRPSDVTFPPPQGSAPGRTEGLLLKRKDALAHRQKCIENMLEEVFAGEEAEGIKISFGSTKRGKTSAISGRASPVNMPGSWLEQTARTCQSYDFTAGATELTKSTLTHARHLQPISGP